MKYSNINVLILKPGIVAKSLIPLELAVLAISFFIFLALIGTGGNVCLFTTLTQRLAFYVWPRSSG